MLSAFCKYLTMIIPQAQMESMGPKDLWATESHEDERINCFSKIQLIGKKNTEAKHLVLVKARL